MITVVLLESIPMMVWPPPRLSAPRNTLMHAPTKELVGCCSRDFVALDYFIYVHTHPHCQHLYIVDMDW